MTASRTICVLLVGLGASAWTVVAQGAGATSSAANRCWSSQAEQRLTGCEGATPTAYTAGAQRGQPSVHFKAKPPTPPKTTEPRAKPGGPAELDPGKLRELREKALQPRMRAMLITEIQGLEQLFRSTPRRAPDRVIIARRLAESYVELENAARRDQTRAEIDKNRQEAAKAGGVVVLARNKAIAYYDLIKRQYASYAKIDEVLYYLAYEYEQAKDLPNARKVYYELIQKAPTSKYIPSAYLAFGELFFGEAQSDPAKFTLAEQAYLEVIKYPPPDNKMFGYAHYKLAYVQWNVGDFARALTHFKSAIAFGTQYPTLPNAGPLAEAARKDLIPVYAISGRPDAAYTFFHSLSGDATNENEKTFRMMDQLGRSYLDTGHYADVIALYRDLMRRDRGPETCLYHAHIAEATLAMRSGDKDAIMKVLSEQVTVMRSFKSAGHGAGAKSACGNATALLLSETAMAWHLEAVGSGGVRGTNDPKTMSAADRLYGMVVDNFTSEEFGAFTFPSILREDWPTLDKLLYHRADLLFAQKNWEACGPAFDAVFARAPKSPQARDALHAAMICYQNVYDQEHAGRSDRHGTGNLPGETAAAANLASRPLTDRQKGMLGAFQRYLCNIKPPDGDKEGWDQLVEVKFARARTYFEAQHWDEAAVAFRDIALQHADHEAAMDAAQLYLEAVNILGEKLEPKKPGCVEQMGDDVPRLLASHCAGPKAAGNESQCSMLTRIECDVQRRAAEGIRDHERAAQAYLAIWNQYGKEPLERKESMKCERLDEVIYNACRAYQAGHLIAKAIQCRRILLDPDNQLSNSPLAHKAIYEIGGNYQAIAVYDQAADWYEKFATQRPGAGDKQALAFWNEKADEALSDAVVLRLGLGQDTKALENARLFERYFGSRAPEQNAQIAFAIGAHYVEQEKWNDARSQLSRNAALVDRHAPLDVRVQAHALLGRAHAALRRDTDADAEYGKVRELWRDPKAAADRVLAEGKDEPESSRVRRLGRALTAVGEARFHAAERLRSSTVDRIAFPAYRSGRYRPPTKKLDEMSSEEFAREQAARRRESDEVRRHIDTKVKAWVEAKRGAIDEVNAAYLSVTELKPAPPSWVIAAASSVGTMWAEFVRDFRRAPIPKWMEADDELRGVYYQRLDEASEPIKLLAKAAFSTCLRRSVDQQYFDHHSRACEEWLAENYRGEFHKVDEFRGSPDLVGSGLNERPNPLQLGGKPYVTAPPDPKKGDKEARRRDAKAAVLPRKEAS